MEKDAAIAHMKMRMEEQNQDIKALLNKTTHVCFHNPISSTHVVSFWPT